MSPASRPPTVPASSNEGPGRRSASTLVPASARPVVATLVVLLLTACGVRLETPPPEPPTPDAVEQVRQDAALSAAELHAAAQAARSGPAVQGEDAGPVRDALLAVETAAAAHHQALGGVWEPWPGAGPDATAYPSDGPTTAEPVTATGRDVLAQLETAATDAHDAALDAPGELAALLGSLAISRTYQAADLAAALGTTARTLPAEPLPEPAPGSVAPATSRAVDAARYALEVVAARSSGGERDAATARAAELAAVAGAVAPELDEREVAYDVSEVTAREGTTPERALAGAAELDVVGAYIHVLTTGGTDRAATLAAATHAAGQARSWDTALPPLPGLS